MAKNNRNSVCTLSVRKDFLNIKLGYKHSPYFKNIIITKDPDYIKNYNVAYYIESPSLQEFNGLLSIFSSVFFRDEFVNSEIYNAQNRDRSWTKYPIDNYKYTIPYVTIKEPSQDDFFNGVKHLMTEPTIAIADVRKLYNLFRKEYHIIVPCEVEKQNDVYAFKHSKISRNVPQMYVKGLANMFNLFKKYFKDSFLRLSKRDRTFIDMNVSSYATAVTIIGDLSENRYSWYSSSVCILGGPTALYLKGEPYTARGEDNNFCEFCSKYLENSEDIIMGGDYCSFKQFDSSSGVKQSCYGNLRFLPEMIEEGIEEENET